MFCKLKLNNCIIVVLASGLLAFGLYHVHSFAGVTEGGVLGLTLLLNHLFGISPAISGIVLNVACYILGWKVLGREFIAYSAIATGGFSVAYKVFEQMTPLWPNIYEYPLLAALMGAMFVGIGAGLCVRAGGAPGGDDALAMGLSTLLKVKIQWIYLASDLTVLLLSSLYIPWNRLWYSLLTVILSGQIIGLVQMVGRKAKNDDDNEIEDIGCEE